MAAAAGCKAARPFPIFSSPLHLPSLLDPRFAWKKSRFAALLCAGGLLGTHPKPARAEFLFNSFLTPSFSTQYSAWDVFYTPYQYADYPDYAAPYGTYGPAPAGYTIPPNANPTNPSTCWDTRNATITQTGTSSAFIIGPGVSGSGNIYSFAAPTSYVLNNTVSSALGTVCFQFQTDGTLLNFSSIQLQYTNGSGNVVSLAPQDILREYRTSGSSFGGIANRSAVQWNLTGLGITSYKIVYSAASSSNSFQLASLDTAATYGDILPAKRDWTAAGGGTWGNGANRQQGSTSNENGNVRFDNTAAALPVLDANHTVGELRFDTPAVTINSPGGYTLTANTGITTTGAATGFYAINSNYRLGAFNLFDVEAGSVQLNGVVSGAYGFEKDGAGSLTLSNNNTFTGAVTVGGGTLRMSGANAYTGSTSVVQGTLVVGADALVNANGPLGNASSNIALGADSSTFQFVGASSAALVIDGNHTVARNVDLANGNYQKSLVAVNTSAAVEATYAGTINFNTSADNVHLTATAATDKLTFSGAMSGGAAAGTVTVDGAGVVVFSGAAKTYANATAVSAGMLQIASGTSFTGAGAMTVNNSASLRVDGTLGGNGTLALNAGVLTGSGTVGRTFAVGTGATLAPGNGVGTLSTAGETWTAGGTYQWELNSTAAGGSGVNPGQDLVSLNGGLSLTASAANRFTLQLRTLTVAGTAGMLAGFNPAANYAWRIATTSGGVTGFDPAEFTVDRSGFGNAAAGTFSVSQVGNDLYLNYAPVPEPSTWFVLRAGMLAVVLARRFRTCT